uniref:T6SS effector BTH_I2691 family protein n=1 Tax=Iodobacter sp. TaxID=1915058 RepID=UPI0025D00754
MAEQITECKNKFCGKKGLMILPLRYALAAHVGGYADFPELSGTLGQGVTDKKLKNAAYTVRMLRHGYLYVMTDRTKKLKWESAWAVNSEGYISSIPLGAATPPPSFSCAPETHGVNASMISIENAKEVTEVRILFLPDPLTLSALNKIEKDKVLSDKLQKFKAKPVSQDHALLPTEIAKKVMEFRSVEISEKRLARLFNNHLHPALSAGAVYEKNVPYPFAARLKNISADLIAKKGIAVVLHDPIGLTQELGRWTNSVMYPLNELMEKKDPLYGIKNEKLISIIDAVSAAEQAIKNNALIRKEPKKGTTAEEIIKRGSMPATYGNYSNASIYQNDADYNRAKDEWYKNTKAIEKIGDSAWNKYGTRLLKKEVYEGTRNIFNNLAAKSDAQHAERSLDWLLWLNSSLLHDTLAFYDNAHLESCGAYASHVGLCIHGLNGSEPGVKWLTEQANAKKIAPGTLLLNGLMLNNKKSMDAFVAAGGLSGTPLPFDKLQEGGKGLTDAWNNIKGVVEHNQNTGNAGQMGGISLLIMQAGSVMLANMPGGKFIDKQVMASSTMQKLLKLSLGKILDKNMAEFYPDPAIHAARSALVHQAQRDQINKVLTQGSGSSQMNGVRFGTVIALLELANILLKSKSMAKDSTPRARAELTAATLGLLAVVSELSSGVCEQLAKSSDRALSSSAMVGVGALKLAAGA